MASQPGLNVSAAAPMYVNGMPIDALGDALAASDASVSGGYSDYWATPERPASSDVQEILDITLSVERMVNRIKFQAAHYPCVGYVQYQVSEGVDWLPILNESGNPIEIRITDSVPRTIDQTGPIRPGSNLSPQHGYPNHWLDYSFRVEPTPCKKIRIVLQRIGNSKPPLKLTRRPADYSLAIKDLDIGYEVESPQDLMRTTTDGPDLDLTQPALASNTDALGSSVDYYLSLYDPSDLNWNALQAQAGVDAEDRESTVWRSDLQTRSDAVVPLYVDVRKGNGEGQVIDCFEVNPITSGVALNLYYSNDDRSTATPFEATDEVVRYPSLSSTGSIIVSDEGLLFGGTGDHLDIDNAEIQWDPRLAWWTGIEFQPQFPSSDTTPRVIFDSPGLRVLWEDGLWKVQFNNDEFALPEIDFAFNQSLIIVAGFDGDVGGEVRFHGETSMFNITTSVPPGNFRIGASFSGVLAGDVRINRLVIKQEALTETNGLTTSAKMMAYTGASRSVSFRPRYPDIVPPLPETQCALLRIDPVFQGRDVSQALVYSNANPFGVLGGPGHFYETLSWVPINREFALFKGLIRFDEVMARYFKFEFTNLAAKPHSEGPLTRPVRISPDMRSMGGQTTTADLDPGAKINQDLATGIRFSDQRGVRITQTQGYQDYKPTEALFTRDSEATKRLKDLAPIFGLEPWHKSPVVHSFDRESVHFYTQFDAEHDTKVAYYVGLKSLRAYRTSPIAPVDSDEYLFSFHDDSYLVQDAEGWDLGSPAGLSSGSSVIDFVRVSSETLLSRRNVRGVQFATVQTPPVQRLSDPEFSDPAMALWQPYGGAQIDRLEDGDSGFGTTVRVRRQPEGAYWNYIEGLYGTWDDIEDLDPSPLLPVWDDISYVGTIELPTGGIEGTEYVDLPLRGRMYAAARVYAPTPLTAPLHIQIVGDDGGVLADQKTGSFQGQVLEWYVAYTVGEGGLPVTYEDWDFVEAYGDWDDVEAVGTWDEVAAASGGGEFDGQVTVRVLQEGANLDVFYVDNISLFEDPIIWEFSNDDGDTWHPAYDICNNPSGVLVFPSDLPIAPDYGTELKWRVSGYRPDLHISSLCIRPWYYGPGMGILPKAALEQYGPNRSPYDQFPAIEDSPRFKAWNKPIPQSWWYGYRQWLMQHADPVAEPEPV